MASSEGTNGRKRSSRTEVIREYKSKGGRDGRSMAGGKFSRWRFGDLAVRWYVRYVNIITTIVSELELEVEGVTVEVVMIAV